MTDTMRAMAATKNGADPVTVSRLNPKAGEVRVRVVAAAVNAAEGKLTRGEFAGRFLHARTSPLVIGWDFSGTVDALGDGVSDLAVGEPVWGHLAFTPPQKQGTYSEFITIPRAQIAAKPDGVSHETAAAAATCAMTSLQALRDDGRLVEGGRALIIGAAGGVGSMAVGIAKRLGAHVTAVCSTRDVERVREMGADVVIDRKTQDPLAGDAAYDVVFDTPAVHSFARCARVLAPGGTYVTTLPDGALIAGMVRALFSSKRCRFIQVVSRREDLELVGGWLSDGMQVPIDSRYKVADLGAALARHLDRERSGRVVVEVQDGW